uniref:Uncharacterized protein n=1 Tax=mine drainage metagenome TaxID=410659 RepID=E6Q1B2_9ZZZZ
MKEVRLITKNTWQHPGQAKEIEWLPKPEKSFANACSPNPWLVPPSGLGSMAYSRRMNNRINYRSSTS